MGHRYHICCCIDGWHSINRLLDEISRTIIIIIILYGNGTARLDY